MARKTEGQKDIQVIVDEAAYQIIVEAAEEKSQQEGRDRKVAVNEIVRDALTEYFQRRGKKVDFSPGTWGGKRR